MKFSAECELYFGSSNLYEILGISVDANGTQVKKAYHKMSLECHPDRVEPEKKAEATEKFKVLSKIHLILSDPEKRDIYNETGTWTADDDKPETGEMDWMAYYRSQFSEIAFNDIQQYEDQYKGSEEEMEDLREIYKKCKGDMDKMSQHILFYTLEDEERIRNLLHVFIGSGLIPRYDTFLNEPQAKRDRRMRKLQKEAKEAEKELAKMKKSDSNRFGDLQKAILGKRQEEPAESFLDALERKYSGPKMSAKTIKKSSRGKAKK